MSVRGVRSTYEPAPEPVPVPVSVPVPEPAPAHCRNGRFEAHFALRAVGETMQSGASDQGSTDAIGSIIGCMMKSHDPSEWTHDGPLDVDPMATDQFIPKGCDYSRNAP
ncbi:hypothetical protein F511_17309 [Dorcoceras hygrometricum]|uniref:Uncharacterized protein n=1 Tax=Dorcoceras hygrometricum TaxID=472368 RepID=A0A2Z7B5V3_9LAMI|nr:hypothetical protein F511_17309 [Dorcoceras hygrometricum]